MDKDGCGHRWGEGSVGDDGIQRVTWASSALEPEQQGAKAETERVWSIEARVTRELMYRYRGTFRAAHPRFAFRYEYLDGPTRRCSRLYIHKVGTRSHHHLPYSNIRRLPLRAFSSAPSNAVLAETGSKR